MFPICLVDDSRDDLLLGERTLRQARVLNPIELLNGGEACLEFLSSHYNAKAPKRPAPLIFMDLAMPSMDGIQTITSIAEMPLSIKPFIVMLSAMTDLKRVTDGYQRGAKTFLAKPFAPNDVILFLKAYEELILIRLTAEGYELDWG